MFTKSWASLALLLIVQTIGLGLFAKGFFPYKTNLSGFASPDDVPPLPEHGNATPKPSFDRLVFMLIDALRSDFVFGESSEMKFVQSLITNRHAIPFTALATAPTVTLPRIKALTTGTVPNFLDAILNIAESDTSTSLAYQDNWLVQFKNSANKSISFFGDDTWIKLFPGIFDRIDGTTSFFVSDTVEVDLNVTRNVIPQLARNDWDVLIFHYLGLDHVGHLAGPCSPLMTPKQQEMDKVVKVIYDTITEQDKERKRLNTNAKPTLFILGGDHGMNEAGNHGGSSAGEITTALVFMSSEYGLFKAVPPTFTIPHNVPYFQYYRVVNQVDLVPTLSYLFGIPIPKNSLGQMLLDVLSDHDVFDQLRALQLNAHQIAGILTSNWVSFNRLPDATVETTLDSNLHCAREENDRDILQCLYKVAYYYHALA
ncbi:6236_t:CDS:2, partial [Paraglomus occultum]